MGIIPKLYTKIIGNCKAPYGVERSFRILEELVIKGKGKALAELQLSGQ